MDAVVNDMNAAYDAGYTGFSATLATQDAASQLALTTLANAVNIPTPEHSEAIARLFDQESEMAAQASSMTVAEFRVWMYAVHSAFLQGMSSIVEGTDGRYAFSNGSQPFADPSSLTADGEAGMNQAGMGLRMSVWDLVHPLVTNRIVRVIIRATRLSDSLQECNDEVYEIELDSNGDVVQPRPNDCFISEYSCDNLTVTFSLQSRIDDEAVASSTLAVYRAASPNPVVYSSPAGSAAASSEITGLRTASVVVTFPSAGFYTVGSKSISAAGVLSSGIIEQTIWVGTEQPAGPLSVEALVIRSSPNDVVEDS